MVSAIYFISGGDVSGARLLNEVVHALDDEISAIDKKVGQGATMSDVNEAWPKSLIMIGDKEAVFAIDPDAAVADAALIGVRLTSGKNVVRKTGARLQRGAKVLGRVWKRVRVELP